MKKIEPSLNSVEQIDEKPDLRSFGASSAKIRSPNFKGLKTGLVLVGSVGLLGVSAFTVYPLLFPQVATPLSMSHQAFATQAPETIPKAPDIDASAPSLEVFISSTGEVVPSAPVKEAGAPTIANSDVVVEHTIPIEVVDPLLKLSEKVTQLKLELAQAKQQLADLEKVSVAKFEPKAISRAKTKTAPKEQSQAEYVSLSVLKINALSVVVSDSIRQYTVTPGAQLPGGAIYIGFDTISRVMKTDQGDFIIP
jgi:hypothetical protein